MILIDFRDFVRRPHCIVLTMIVSLCWMSTDISRAATISVRHFRGICTSGNIGDPCNSAADCGSLGACGATVSSTDDSTLLSSLQGAFMDLYRGQTSASGSVGSLIYPEAVLSAAACWIADWTLPETNVLDITADPDPPLESVVYYDYTLDLGAGTSNNVNQMDCSNPGICKNPGWCDQGGTPGAPCTDSLDCSGGTCVLMATGCSNDAGTAPFGNGCSAHSVCTVGGQLCTSTPLDCPTSTCAAPIMAAGVCVNTNLSSDPVDAAGCLPNTSDPLYITRVVPDAVISACP